MKTNTYGNRKHPKGKVYNPCWKCGKHSSYGYKTTKKRTSCKAHAAEGMEVIYKHKTRCQHPACETYPRYNLPTEKKGKYCYKHKKKHMIGMYKILCLKTGCNITPSYGTPGYNPVFCARHKPEWMKHLNAKICKAEHCTTHATFGLKTQTHCKSHSAEGFKRIYPHK